MLFSMLLAGGKSTRMGEDKAGLIVEGQTLLDRSLALLEKTGSDRILLSGDIPGYDCLPDLIPDCGPPGGLHAALHFIDEEFGLDGSLLLIMPIDMPLLDPGTLSKLVMATGEADSSHFRDEIFPCVFRLTPKLKTHLDALYAESTERGGPRSMQTLLGKFDGKILEKEDVSEDVFLNVNRPEEWTVIQSKISK
jgi:molybdenum cofactor guanylyltransferase